MHMIIQVWNAMAYRVGVDLIIQQKTHIISWLIMIAWWGSSVPNRFSHGSWQVEEFLVCKLWVAHVLFCPAKVTGKTIHNGMEIPEENGLMYDSQSIPNGSSRPSSKNGLMMHATLSIVGS